MNTQQVQQIRNAFDSILRADYITLDNINELENLENYYIDFFGINQSLLQKQDSFIAGRRGTGKTTNLLRAYFECLKTISSKLKNKKNLFNSEKVLPIYIDLSKCTDLFDTENDLELIEIHFIRQMIESLKKQLDLMFDDSFLVVFKKENPALDDLDLIEKILVEGIALRNTKSTSVVDREQYSRKDNIKASADLQKIGISANCESGIDFEKTQAFSQLRGINVQDFLNKINKIKKKAKIDYIYIFIDEYSDLSNNSQLKFASLLKTFLGSKMGMFFKVGVITDRFDFGDKIIIGRDIFPIPLNFSDFVDRYGGAMAAMNKMQDFAEILVTKRIDKFCPELNFSDIFKANKNEAFSRISKESIGVPRTIGIILQQAFIQAQAKEGDKKLDYPNLIMVFHQREKLTKDSLKVVSKES